MIALKKNRISVLPVVVIGIFILCFIIGKFFATKNTKKEDRHDGGIQITDEIVSPASSKPEKIKELAESKEHYQNSKVPEIEEQEEKLPPERMMFPCGQRIINDYTQEPVFSKTMKDWRIHTGIDYEAQTGGPVFCVWDGTVQKVYKDLLWGYSVEILHDGNIISKYKNLDKKVLVKEGEFVKGGQAIGKVGDSAIIEIKENPHLHFELWTGGEPINPKSYIY